MEIERDIKSSIFNLSTEGVETILADTLQSYANDFSKYVDNKDVPRIHDIWKSIPSQLSRENNKFIFRIVRSGARARDLQSSIFNVEI